MTLSDAAIVSFAEQAAIDARLADQARRLALLPAPPEESRAIDVLVCRLGIEEYALELRLLHGVFPATGLTPVPCTPQFVAGLLNLRGEILTVLDLAAALGLASSDQREVILVETHRVRACLLVGEVLGVRRIALDALDHALAGNDFTRGIANARTVLLDLEALLTDARFDPSHSTPETHDNTHRVGGHHP
jgi:purine-binding chemotaxis protein CheW